MDRMFIRDLKRKCIVGTKPEERTTKQTVIINVVLECDLRKAGRTDRLEHTANYKKLSDAIKTLTDNSRYFLIERLADRIADLCLRVAGVKAVTVTVDKPGALHQVKSAAVEIRRTKTSNKEWRARQTRETTRRR